MKSLVTAACVALIVGVTYYIWRDMQDRKAIADATALTVLKNRCHADAYGRAEPGFVSSEDPKFLGNCIFRGFVTNDDLAEIRRRAASNGIQFAG